MSLEVIWPKGKICRVLEVGILSPLAPTLVRVKNSSV